MQETRIRLVMSELSLSVRGLGCAVFDCDGVIIDSNAVKTNAFREALAAYPAESVDDFVSHHLAHGGMSRFDKLRRFFMGIEPAENVDAAVDEAVSRFEATVLEGLLDCENIPGVEVMLRALADANVPCFVVSGGFQEEVAHVLKARGLERYFEVILGSPKTKIENLTELRDAGRLSMPSLFFGDSRVDLEAARKLGMHFVFVSGRSDWADGEAYCVHEGIPVIVDFANHRLFNGI